ncbi:MAG: Xaa-Pro peptidase family protein [Actinomycetota bacterium]|nr:Xaa-Pro peptidase family protein [Actinomycetota bacterium]
MIVVRRNEAFATAPEPVATRADRLAARLAEPELDALLVTDLTNVRYLTGFSGTNGLCVVGAAGERAFLTDFRYLERAEAEVEGFDRARGERDLLADAAARLSGRVGFDDAHLSVRAHRRLSGLVAERGVELVPAAGLVEELRAVKEPAEIEAMRAAAALADGVYEYLAERGLVGRSEREVALDLEREMRERGAEDPSFPSIVAAGPNGALPHADPRREPIPANTLVVVDMGAVVDGYCSDCTRTFATGPLPDEAVEVYELVLRAQQAALEAVRAGAGARAVDAIAREMIADAGHGERFGHGLGHGVGLEVHEAPTLSPRAEGELAAGNAVTVEPGVYVAGAFGVRIEDLVVVTEGGCEVLTGFPKTLATLGA